MQDLELPSGATASKVPEQVSHLSLPQRDAGIDPLWCQLLPINLTALLVFCFLAAYSLISIVELIVSILSALNPTPLAILFVLIEGPGRVGAGRMTSAAPSDQQSVARKPRYYRSSPAETDYEDTGLTIAPSFCKDSALGYLRTLNVP